MKTKMTLREWLPLIGMTISAFLVNTSEFMPIGLLTDISNEFHMTEAQAGVMITAYSWTVTLLSLPLMLLVCRIQPKKLLLGTLSVFAVCQVLSVISSGFTFLVLSRIGVACAHSIFWAIASPVAVRVVAKEHQSKALSAIITGTSIAMVIGMPLGRMIGLQIGWRMTFLCVAIVSFLVLGYLAFVFSEAGRNRIIFRGTASGAFQKCKIDEYLCNYISCGDRILYKLQLYRAVFAESSRTSE